MPNGRRSQLLRRGATDCDKFTEAIWQRLSHFIDLNAGDRAGPFDQFHQLRAVPRLLPDGLIVEDDA